MPSQAQTALLRERVLDLVVDMPETWLADHMNIVATEGNQTLVVIARGVAAEFLVELLPILPDPHGAIVESIPVELIEKRRDS